MFFNDPFYTTNFSPRYNTMSQYADRTCNCPECRPACAPRRVQQNRRAMPTRRQVPERQIVTNPEEWFHEQNQTVQEPRKKPRKKIAKKTSLNPPKAKISDEKPIISPKKPVKIPIEIVNAPKNQQKQAEKVGDRKILTKMENLILEELSTPIEIKEDLFYADEEIVIPPQE